MSGMPPPSLPVLTVADLRSRYPRVGKERLHFLTTSGYWDGPLSGMVQYGGEICWFNIITPLDEEPTANPETDGFGEPRTFALFRLTEAQVLEEQRWHALFMDKVGTNTSPT